MSLSFSNKLGLSFWLFGVFFVLILVDLYLHLRLGCGRHGDMSVWEAEKDPFSAAFMVKEIGPYLPSQRFRTDLTKTRAYFRQLKVVKPCEARTDRANARQPSQPMRRPRLYQCLQVFERSMMIGLWNRVISRLDLINLNQAFPYLK